MKHRLLLSIITAALFAACNTGNSESSSINNSQTNGLQLDGYNYIGDVTATHLVRGEKGDRIIKPTSGHPYTYVIQEELDCPMYEKDGKRFIVWKGGICEVDYSTTDFFHEGFHGCVNTNGRGLVYLH